MAYTQQGDGTIIINGFEKGVSDDPYKGLSDMRNMNIVSIPGEASVNFKTSLASPTTAIGTITSANSTDKTVTLSFLTGSSLGQGQAVTFAGGSLPSGLTAGTTYWVSQQSSTTYFVYTNPNVTTLAAIAGTGTGNFSTVNIGTMKYFTKLNTSSFESYWGVDSNGRVWANMFGSGNWNYTGNSITTRGADSYKGAGIAAYIPSNNTGSGFTYIFVFSAGAIDYAKITSNTTIVWNYGWRPSLGTTGNSNYLKTSEVASAIHETFAAPDNVVYYCDARYIGRFYELTGQNFDPAVTTTYIFDETGILPTNDSSTCLAFLGTSILIGGQKNIIYTWNTTSPTFDYPIMIAESYISKMVTLNTNTFILAGNRGRIYYTNGSQAQLFKKLPDHISGTIEPYFQWGGIATTKNQLYVSANCTTNGGTALTTYGGVWGIDVDTKALRMTNKLSYNTYAGYASAIIPVVRTDPASANPGGAGLIIGWDSGASTYGIDTTSSSLYSGSESYVDSDLIPIGTVLTPTTNGTVEFKLATPLNNGDTIKIQYRQKFSDSFADITTSSGITTFSYNATTPVYSGVYQNINFEKSQWIQFRVVTSSTGNITTSGFVRLTEIRVK